MNALQDKSVDASTFVSPSSVRDPAPSPRPAVPVNAFRHVVRWNDAAVCIETHLEVARDVHCELDDRDFSIETIHTENSLKYRTRDTCVPLLPSGWAAIADWSGQKEFSSLSLVKEGAAPSAPYLCEQAGDLDNYGAQARRRRSA
jgi:Histidine-specific methyltransferase, SAM-dependent